MDEKVREALDALIWALRDQVEETGDTSMIEAYIDALKEEL